MKKIPVVLGACCILSASLLAPQVTANEPAKTRGEFPFRDGDRVVFLGDSITQQMLHTTYLETYLLTRFPNWKLQFRNAGWGGDTSYLRTRGLPPKEALQRDVLDLKPTVVTINFGMNDAGYPGAFNQGLFDAHVTGETAIVQQLKAAKVRPIIFTPNAVEMTDPGDAMIGYNQTLEQFAAADAELAAREDIPFADQLHPYAAAVNRLRAIDPKLRITADTVHPLQPGQLLMANFLLTGLNAPSLVSSATINARSGSATETEGAKITNVVRTKDGLTFSRLDKALVFPIESAARPALKLVPVAEDINRYVVRVTNLQPGAYVLSVNGKAVSRFSAAQLSGGVNLGFYESALTAPGLQIMAHVREKNNQYFHLWRTVRLGGLPAAEKNIQIAALETKIAAEEQAINALRKPPVFQFEIKRATMPAAPAVTPPAVASQN